MCRLIAAGQAVDVIELDAASRGNIDDIRELRESVQYVPTLARYKVVILDEAHQIGGVGAYTAAANALLKTLEEPPAHVIFILVTTEPHRILPTIMSRCQRFDFHNVSLEAIVQRLRYVSQQEHLTVEDAALWAIARAAEGSVRDALSILDQMVAYGREHITAADVQKVLGTLEADVLFQLGEVLAAYDTARGLRLLDELIDAGKEARHLIAETLQHFRNLLLTRLNCASEQLAAFSAEMRQRLREQAAKFTPERLLHIIETWAKADKDLRWSPQPRLVLELAVITLTSRDLQPEVREAGVISPSQEAPEAAEGGVVFAPAPATEPSPWEAVSAEEEPSQQWAQVLETVKERRMPTFTLIMDAVPLSCDEQVLRVGFRPEHSRRLNWAEDPEHRTVIEQAVEEAFGRPLRVQYLLLETDNPGVAEAGEESLSLEQAIAQVVRHFPGSQVLETPLRR